MILPISSQVTQITLKTFAYSAELLRVSQSFEGFILCNTSARQSSIASMASFLRALAVP